MKAQKIYQLTSYVNAYNKRLKKWESLRSVTTVYAGKEGLKTACKEFENEVYQYKQLTTVGNWRKYSETRGKVEVHEPHIHDNGMLAYWGDKIILSHNPDKI
jgi:hypothetical protein